MRPAPNSGPFLPSVVAPAQKHCTTFTWKSFDTMEINPQFFALQELSIRDSRLLDRLEGSQERLEKLDELMAKIDASVEKYGAAPQRLLDQMDAVIAKVASITDRIEARASDALASDIAQIRC